MGRKIGAVALVRRAGVRVVVNDDVARLELAELLQEMSNREREASGVSRDAGGLGDHVAIAVEEPARKILAFAEAGRIGRPHGRRHHLLDRRQEIVAHDLRAEGIKVGRLFPVAGLEALSFIVPPN